MEQRQTDGAVATTRVRALRRWEPLTGIAFAVLFVAGFLIANTPSDSDANSVWTKYFADRGNRIEVTVSAYLILIAGLCLLAFLTTLWMRIASARRPGVTSPLGLVAAGVAVACIATGAVVQASVSGAMLFGSTPEPGPDTLRLVFNLMFPVVAVAGGIAASVSVATLTIQAHGARLLGRPLLTLGLVVAVGLLAAVFFFPIVLLPVWAIVMSVVLVRRGTATPAEAAAPATAQLTGTAVGTPAGDGATALR